MFGFKKHAPRTTPEKTHEPAATSDTEMPGKRTPAGAPAKPSQEIGGPTGPEPTRYGDWELKGRAIDF